MRSTTQGLLLPRLTTAQREAIATPVAGLLVFQTDNAPGVYYFDGALWRNLSFGTVAPPPGTVSTLAGSGTAGSANGTGTAAQFNRPYGVATDNNGTLYVADFSNNRVQRIVIASGAVTTLAPSGSSFLNPTGVACDNNGGLFVTDRATLRRVQVASGATTDIIPNNGQLFYPNGLAYDGANGLLYVADEGNNRVLRVVLATGAVTTLAGGPRGFADGPSTTARFNTPASLALDGTGLLYVADQDNHRIRRIALATGLVSTLAGSGAPGFADGAPAAALFNSPTGVAYDASGNVLVADRDNHRIRRIAAATGTVTTRAGSGTAGFADGPSATAQFNAPYSVAYDISGTLYVADQGSNRIRVIR